MPGIWEVRRCLTGGGETAPAAWVTTLGKRCRLVGVLLLARVPCGAAASGAGNPESPPPPTTRRMSLGSIAQRGDGRLVRPLLAQLGVCSTHWPGGSTRSPRRRWWRLARSGPVAPHWSRTPRLVVPTPGLPRSRGVRRKWGACDAGRGALVRLRCAATRERGPVTVAPPCGLLPERWGLMRRSLPSVSGGGLRRPLAREG